MKPVTPEVQALLDAGEFACYELYTLTTFSGEIIRLTNCQVDVAWGGNVWSSKGARVDPKGSRSTAHFKIGLDVDEWTLVVLPRTVDALTGEPYPDKIGSEPWVSAARAGALDNAYFDVSRAYFAAAPTFPLPAGNAAIPVGVIVLFSGITGELEPGDTRVSIKALDWRVRLSAQIPNRYYRATCRHTLFDAGCRLSAAAFKRSGTVLAGSTQNSIVAAVTAPPGSGSFALGRVVMTSGANAGFQCSVRTWFGGVLSLLRPLPYPVSAGDTFDAYPGCNKTRAQCVQFGNEANYGGEPSIPTPETAI